jgi:PleD family two-component response regulator
VGLAALTPEDGSAAGLISRAQEALVAAKAAGGNCLIRL